MKTLFLTLRTFSATGGIEKVSRILGKALYEDSIKNEGTLQVCSMYDRQSDAFNNLYFPAENFSGFAVHKLRFIKEMVVRGAKNDLVILSHINLLVIGWLIKKIAPHTKIVLLGHGIEIWYPLRGLKKKMLQYCDTIIAVSSFTRTKIIEVHGVSSHKCAVLNNCLDPFLPVPSFLKKNQQLLRKYGFKQTDKILMTLTRLSSKERYKGYDKVIQAMAQLKNDNPQVKYLIAGTYDSSEKAYVERLIKEQALEGSVIMSGYIPDSELEKHFALSDLYIMPSRKEGFGLVFLEAMYYGLAVIAGNLDGSTDALLQGKLGQLVDPDNIAEISGCISNILENKTAFKPDHKMLIKHFSYEIYKKNLEAIINISW